MASFPPRNRDDTSSPPSGAQDKMDYNGLPLPSGSSSTEDPFSSGSFLPASPSEASGAPAGAAGGPPTPAMIPGIDVMAQLASQYYTASRNRSISAPIPPTSLRPSSAWQFNNDAKRSAATTPPLPPSSLGIMTSMDAHQGEATSSGSVGAAGAAPTSPPVSEMQSLTVGTVEPENEPSDGGDKAEPLMNTQLPATFLRTICDQVEFYFCDENLLGDLFLLKNMTMDGYVKLELLASFGRVKKLTTDMEQVRKALELSTKLIMNEDQTMVCRKESLPPNQTYHGKLARTAIAYNLPEDCSIASLRETFQGCGEITYLRLLKKNTITGRNAVLKPPIVAGETYVIIEFVDEEMAKHAVLTLSDQYNPISGLQVVLFDGTSCERLKQRMFPDVGGGDRRRAKSASAVTRPVHVDAVGEGLDDLREGKVNTGTVYSIRGAGGLITPTRRDNSCISFRLIPDEDGNIDIRQGDYVSFTVGKNKKSGRKYASKVKLEFRPPQSFASDLSEQTSNRDRDTSNRWEGRGRACTVGAPTGQPAVFRSRSSSSGTRPRLNLSSPRTSTSPTSTNSMAAGLLGSNPLYRQAVGPDGSKGFASRRSGNNVPEVVSNRKFSQPTERRRASSSAPAMQY